MLSELQIENIGIIDSLSIEFHAGLNALTGETGAGKSIIISSFSLILGERVSPQEIIRAGCESGKVKGLIFLDESHPVINYLKEKEISCLQGELLISREINLKGRNKCFLNGELVNLSLLKELGDLLVDIHGAHDHQKLLNPLSHIFYLDRFGGLDKNLSEYRIVYESWKKANLKLKQYQEDLSRKNERLDLLSYEIDDLSYLENIDSSEEEIDNEYEILSNAREIEELSNEITSDGEEGDNSILYKLKHFKRNFEELARYESSFKEQVVEIDSLTISVRDALEKVLMFVSNMSSDPKRLDVLESLISKLQKHKLKYGKDFEGLKSLFFELKRERKSITDPEGSNDLKSTIQKEESMLSKLATLLSGKRKEAAKKLKKNIEKEFKDLGMSGAEFFIEFNQVDYTSQGRETLEFLLITNPGDSKKPLIKIASGGELSRIMLAFKAIVSIVDDIPILVFDEIDANIGGVTAVAAANKMQNVSLNRQVIVITHQPQIAAKAKKHFAVSKSSDNNKTTTKVTELDREHRVNEISRMLGGSDITSVVKEHAREMLFG